MKKESGFGTYDHDYFKALIRSGLSGQEFSFALMVMRKTTGYKKKWDTIPIRQVREETGITDRKSISRIRLNLSKRGIIVYQNVDGCSIKYSFQTDFTRWKPSTKMTTVKKPQTVYQNVDRPSTKMTTVDSRYKGDKLNSKKKPPYIPPAGGLKIKPLKIPEIDSIKDWEKHLENVAHNIETHEIIKAKIRNTQKREEYTIRYLSKLRTSKNFAKGRIEEIKYQMETRH